MNHIPDDIKRFFTSEGALSMIPSKQAPRLALLTWMAHEVLRPGEALDEASLNLRLRRYYDDVAMLRRYMVERGLLLRDPSGRDYRLPDESDA